MALSKIRLQPAPNYRGLYRFMPKLYSSAPPLLAHRGASAYAPENTASAIRKAAELGATWCEVDVAITADHVAVIFHDPELERCSNGTGLLVKHSLAELKELDAGSWFSPEFAGEKILTLAELITLANELKLGLNLEIKPIIGLEEETVKAMKVAFTEVQPEQPIMLSSFSPCAMKAVQEHLPNSTRALNTEAIPENWQSKLEDIGAVGLHFRTEFYDTNKVKEIRQAGFFCMVFTVNDKATALQYLADGVNAIFSDKPLLLAD